MKLIKLKTNESIKEVTLDRARQLLKNMAISDEALKKLMDNLRAFCRIVIDIHQRQEKQKQGKEQNETDDFKEAA